jgi:hypothetical protein
MKCSNHAEADAGWRCTDCGKCFCENCIKLIGGRSEQVAVCPACGERCEETISREEALVGEEPSFWERLPRIVSYPLQKDGFVILILGSILFAIGYGVAMRLRFLGYRGLIFAILLGAIIAGYLCRYLLSVISDSATGKLSPPTWADFVPGSFLEETAEALLKFVAPAALSYAPACVYYFFGAKAVDSTFGILVAAGSLYFPMGLLAVAYFDDTAALNPVPILRSILRVPLRYLVTCMLFMLLLCLVYLGQRYATISIVIIGSLVRWFVFLYLWTLALHLLGMFYYTNRHRLRWS